MFVQAFEGRAADREGLRRQLERWMIDLRPGARGFLGSTAGVTDDGDAFVFARFETKVDGMANSERAEQGQWWADTEKCFDGDVRFSDSADVDSFLAGGSNDAGFVQIMRGPGIDRGRVHALDDQFEAHAASFRPDLLGGFRMWTGSDSYLEVAYFTNEAEAREGESKEPPAELAEQMGDFEQLMANVEFIDLREPWLF
ncbi:MAG: hypothetical protein ACR2HP_01115 [Ilumatobacteraceae bacterium]